MTQYCKHPGNCLSDHKCIECRWPSGGLKYCNVCVAGRDNFSNCERKRCIYCNHTHQCKVCGKVSNTFDVCNCCSDYAIPVRHQCK
jgi:hypothetical protein